ncbi:phosphoenolpyruvate carboxykinase (ATP), partial [Escherichia coli]|uniref:phosphoenolpyruvate carboxykinase (ATP) n=1 Tax=Escherichia coli TaxID=562 RepID=UPI0010CC31D0
SPKDKYIVRDDTTRDTFWWADTGKGKNDNKPLPPETWQHLKGPVTKPLSGKRPFVFHACLCANPDPLLSCSFVPEKDRRVVSYPPSSVGGEKGRRGGGGGG